MLLIIRKIDSVPAGSIVFISAPSCFVNAVYGGLMSTRAKQLRAEGTIVDGRIRDLQEHRDLDYPVRSLSPSLVDVDILILGRSQVFARDVGTASPNPVLRVSEVSDGFTPKVARAYLQFLPNDSGKQPSLRSVR